MRRQSGFRGEDTATVIKGELTCPCCRAEVQPVLKQQIRNLEQAIKDMAEYCRLFPAIQQQYIVIQNEKIAKLEEELRQAKANKRLVSAELSESNRHNKEILENLKSTKKSLLEKQRVELIEYQKKKAEMRSATKIIKLSKNIKSKSQLSDSDKDVLVVNPDENMIVEP